MLEADVDDANLSAIAQAIQGALRQSTTGQRSPATGSGGAAKALIHGSNGTHEEAEATDEDDRDSTESIDASAPEEEAAERSTATRPRRPRAIPKPPPPATNLRQDDNPTLPEFCAGLNLQADTKDIDKMVVIAHWLRDTRDIKEFGASEIYSSYGLMDWSPPGDITSPMRNSKKGKFPPLDVKDDKWFLTMYGEKRFRELKKTGA